jgi:hypothetical protein
MQKIVCQWFVQATAAGGGKTASGKAAAVTAAAFLLHADLLRESEYMTYDMLLN